MAYRVFSTAWHSVEEKAIVEGLWNDTVAAQLKDELWNDKNIYDAGHYLMVPMHAAFLQDNVHWQKQLPVALRSSCVIKMTYQRVG